MKNILPDGDKSEVIKIMPSGRNFGKTIALAIMLALSGCVEKNLDPEAFPADQAYGIGEEEMLSDRVSLEHHPDYALKKDRSGYEFTNGHCINPDTCENRSIVLKNWWTIYVRVENDSLWAPKYFIGSYTGADSLETEIQPGVLVIESEKK